MNESPWDDLDIKKSSSREQSEAGMEGLSKGLAFLFQSLLSEKFTREEAMLITLQYMKLAFDTNNSNG